MTMVNSGLKGLICALIVYTTVCPTVEDGPKGKFAFRYRVSQFSKDFNEIVSFGINPENFVIFF